MEALSLLNHTQHITWELKCWCISVSIDNNNPVVQVVCVSKSGFHFP